MHHHRILHYTTSALAHLLAVLFFFMFMYSNPIVVHRIFYLCKILHDLLPKPLLLTILLTSQAIELESTSKTVSFNALTSTSLDCMVAFSLVVVLTCQQQYFWRWMATMKDEICLLFWIIHPTRKQTRATWSEIWYISTAVLPALPAPSQSEKVVHFALDYNN